MARTQTTTVAALAIAGVTVRSTFTGGPPFPTLPTDTTTWLSVAYLAVLATAAAMVLLSWSQSRITATRAAIILTLEPAAAAVTAALLGAELNLRTMLGGTLLFSAMRIAELRPGIPVLITREARQSELLKRSAIRKHRST